MKKIEQTFLDSLVGQDVATATSRVEDLGWETWAYQKGHAVAAVLVPDTVMLAFDAETNQVVSACPNDLGQLAA